VTSKLVLAFNTGFTELYPVFCGCENCGAGHDFGPGVRDYYIMHCVVRGRGVFIAEGKRYELTAGHCFLISPGRSVYYCADDADPWSYVWLGFGGSGAQGMVRAAGLCDTPVTDCAGAAEAFMKLGAGIMSGRFDGYGNELAMLAALCGIFSCLPCEAPPHRQSVGYVNTARSYIERSLSDPISVGGIAAYCGLDRHYLCRIFRKCTGMTTQQYLVDRRMSRARALLGSGTLSVGDAARSVGYTDCFNFSKMYKKYFGVSPSQARREARAAAAQAQPEPGGDVSPQG
jgi:AraC-like DNA-binding protein